MSKSISIKPEEKTDEKTDVDPQKGILCKSCQHVVTNPSLSVQPHEHTFRNPAGYSFHVLCFSDAPGTTSVGDPTDEATWFPGYAWTFAICTQCHEHLGWWYSGKDTFAGLIAQRLIR